MPVRPVRIITNRGSVTTASEWWWSFHLAQEKKRGMDNQEDLFSAGTINAELALYDTLALAFTIEQETPLDWETALQAERERQGALLLQADLDEAPPWIRQLALAADQFIVTRNIGSVPGTSILAGYPWFSDWGRDTMIALPGLTLAVGRQDEAAAVLRTFAQYVDQGMLPNRFRTKAARRNTTPSTYAVVLPGRIRPGPARRTGSRQSASCTVWSTFWTGTVRARASTSAATHPTACSTRASRGPAHRMDAKIDEWVVTPRIGKPVESTRCGSTRCASPPSSAPSGRSRGVGAFRADGRARPRQFQPRFWYSGGYLYDVIDGPEGDDHAAPHPDLRGIAAVRTARRTAGARRRRYLRAKAVTSYGLRSLAPDGQITSGTTAATGSARRLLPSGHRLVVAARAICKRPLQGLRRCGSRLQLPQAVGRPSQSHGLGNISEIFDGDPPHTPRGAIAQAWSVAEVLRVWRELGPALALSGLPDTVRIGA